MRVSICRSLDPERCARPMFHDTAARVYRIDVEPAADG